MNGIGMGIGGGFMWILWILLIVAVVWAGGALRPTGEQTPRSARQLLDERYARGELDDQEYRKRRAELSG